MSIYDTHKPIGGSGNLYFKLKDGETGRIRIASEPAIYETEGERDGKTVLSTRYAWVVWNQDLQMPQVMQQSGTFFKNIAALAQDEEWGDPTGYDIKITRHGANFNDTTYTVTPSANRELLSAEAEHTIRDFGLLEKISASPFAQRVMWLAEFEKQEQVGGDEGGAVGNGGEASSYQKAQAAAQKLKPSSQKKDVVIEDIDDDKPIDLDSIPF